MEAYVLRCSRCGCSRPFETIGRCDCGGTLLVEYDIERIGAGLRREDLLSRAWTMWRYRELLPVRDPFKIVTLGEGGTPLLRLKSLERELGLGGLYSKREELNPTGSFKARGFSAAVTLLHERGVRRVAVNSNGNAATALAAYAARCGMEAHVFVPRDCPGLILEECLLYGAHTYLVDGLIQDAGAIISEGVQEQGWFHVGTLKEPGRAEGKKTMGLEAAEQLGWVLPDVIVYPTGGGSGVIGLWRAFEQLKALGWVQGELPRFVSVQEIGCEPVVHGMSSEAGAGMPEAEAEMPKRDRCAADSPPDVGRAAALRPGEAAPGKPAVTSQPTGLRVPKPPDLQLLLDILRTTGGTAVAVSAADIREAAGRLARHGLSASPEGAAAWAGLVQLHEQGWLRPGETVVIFNTSHAAKYWPWKVTKPVPGVRTYEDFVRLRGRPGG
ncbi:threonine synthase [Paenibacillus chartarius]|uniref:Threonine synthase n=1 Tax=Paenibacillus chartarius TaxID=747481 RepID=A0ABV6DEE3_9BACL